MQRAAHHYHFSPASSNAVFFFSIKHRMFMAGLIHVMPFFTTPRQFTMSKFKLTPSPRCPECGSGDFTITAFCCVCNRCGEYFIPDNWLDDAEDLVHRISASSRKIIGKRTPKQGDFIRILSRMGVFIRTTGPLLKKTPELLKLVI